MLASTEGMSSGDSGQPMNTAAAPTGSDGLPESSIAPENGTVPASSTIPENGLHPHNLSGLCR